MPYCSRCEIELQESARFCPSCGAPASSLSQLPTAPPSHVDARWLASPSAAAGDATTPFDRGGFAPGAVFAGRFRIIGLLGRGGMGEVYRADDLKLGQPVALKFLPRAFSQDPALLERFHAEVRNARQVSHPNVCRVYDIGDFDGRHFLTMEYVDGEDLAMLMKRIGRLSAAKALEIACQLCAGLAAAHERGVLHRDLKPSNVMLDSYGRARITDFGLALRADEVVGWDTSGTPAYMAPEQLAGKGASAQSDLYSLGLVLYELYTGKRAFEAAGLEEWKKKHSETLPTSHSSHAADVDPAMERAILLCLEQDPQKRPASALQLAAVLPGGSPLAAALAAGQTPSPEMVAAAGETKGVRPALAVTYLAFALAGLIAACFLLDKVKLTTLVPLENPPEVLVAKARGITTQFGYATPPVDTAFGFDLDAGYLRYIQEHDKSASRWKKLSSGEPPAIFFWYRQSPRYLETDSFWLEVFGAGVSTGDPPRDISDMIFVLLDSRGRLMHFEAVPPQRDESNEPPAAPNWAVLFSAAGLDLASFQFVDPQWTPLAWGDSRVAWTGNYPGQPDVPLRIEAASYRGKPIYFDLVRPWDRPDRMEAYEHTAQVRSNRVVALFFFLAILVGGVAVVRRNVRVGRGDRRGAFRLALFAFMVSLLVWTIGANHVPTFYQVGHFVMAMSWSLFAAGLTWTLYIALEPYVRRRWPNSIISWTRLIAGHVRDPLVGRDLLIGVLFGAGLTLFVNLPHFAETWFGKGPPAPLINATIPLRGLLGLRGAAAALLSYIPIELLFALGIFFTLFLLRIVLRKEWLAATAFVFIFTAPDLAGDYPVVDSVITALSLVGVIVILKRFGLVTFVVGIIVFIVLDSFPTTTRLSAWYAGSGLFDLLTIAAVAVYGFHASLAGRRIFRDTAFDD